jgi:uncharacterized protein YbaA (DUF1428 family)
MAEEAAKIWREHGALAYRECIGEDMDAKEMVPFLQMAGAGSDETVVFAWILFESLSSRDQVNAKMMSDERLKKACAKTARCRSTTNAWPLADLRLWSKRNRRSCSGVNLGWDHQRLRC